ncbi:MAG: DUF4349 domain-containing protein [Clostridia bacterium]|nr:DUF4349 domain-containing protein [Clostridia bacterium]
MKKKLFLIGIVATALALSSCSGRYTEADIAYDSNGIIFDDGIYAEESKAYAPQESVAVEYEAPGLGYSTYTYSAKAEEEAEVAYEVSDSVQSQTDGKTSANVSASYGRKIIYSSSYDVETLEFDSAVKALGELCEKYGAYYESSNTYGKGDNPRSGRFTVRVPVANYNAFVGEAEVIGDVVRSSQNNRDVTESYTDTEARLESARLREERVLAILAEASKLDDVLALERELSEIRYEIERYTGTLRKYDSLVSLATMQINIDEVFEKRIVEPKNPSFGERVSKAFTSGIEEFKDSSEDFFVFLTYNFITLIIWAIIIIGAVIVVKVIRRRRKVKKAKAEEKRNEEI